MYTIPSLKNTSMDNQTTRKVAVIPSKDIKSSLVYLGSCNNNHCQNYIYQISFKGGTISLSIMRIRNVQF